MYSGCSSALAFIQVNDRNLKMDNEEIAAMNIYIYWMELTQDKYHWRGLIELPD